MKLLDSQEAKFSRAQAQETMESFLVKYPAIDLVIALNDEMAIGCYNAIVAAGRVDEMLISGFDGAPEGLQAVLDGQISATLNQSLPGQGSEVIKAVKTYLDAASLRTDRRRRRSLHARERGGVPRQACEVTGIASEAAAHAAALFWAKLS